MPRKPQPCGTLAAVRRHRRAGEPLCDACREVQRLDGVERRAKKATRPDTPSKQVLAPFSLSGFLDRRVELIAIYIQLSERMATAPDQSLAAIARERRAVLDALTLQEEKKNTKDTSRGGDVIDEIAARRKKRRAGT